MFHMGCPVARYSGINEVLTYFAKGATSGLLPSGSTPIPRCGASLVKLIDPTTILPLKTLTFDTLAKYVHTCKNIDATLYRGVDAILHVKIYGLRWSIKAFIYCCVGTVGAQGSLLPSHFFNGTSNFFWILIWRIFEVRRSPYTKYMPNASSRHPPRTTHL